MKKEQIKNREIGYPCLVIGRKTVYMLYIVSKIGNRNIFLPHSLHHIFIGAVLEEKAAEGVEVRLMYDGFNSILKLPRKYPEKLREKGITSSIRTARYNSYIHQQDLCRRYMQVFRQLLVFFDGPCSFGAMKRRGSQGRRP